jgi:YidC/Oxa1 family membrane protein insertase
MFTLPLFNPAIAVAYNTVTTLAGWLAPVTGSLGTTLAIVVFTSAVRLLIHPLTRAQVRAEQARAALAPQLTKLQDRHGGDKARLYQETTNLYRRHGVSQAAGCLPALAQLPVLGLMYQLFMSRTIAGAPNGLLAHTLGGVPLGSRLSGVVGAGHVAVGQVAVFAALLLALAAIATWSSMRARAAAAAAVTLTGAGTAAAQPGAMARLPRLLPYITVVTAAFVPLATGVYLATTTLWTVAERALLARGGS